MLTLKYNNERKHKHLAIFITLLSIIVIFIYFHDL